MKQQVRIGTSLLLRLESLTSDRQQTCRRVANFKRAEYFGRRVIGCLNSRRGSNPATSRGHRMLDNEGSWRSQWRLGHAPRRRRRIIVLCGVKRLCPVCRVAFPSQMSIVKLESPGSRVGIRVAPTDSVSDASTMPDIATRELQSGTASTTDESASRMNLGLRLVPTPKAQICMLLHASCALCSLGWLNRAIDR